MEGAQPQTSTESAQPQTSTGSAQPQTRTGSAQRQTSTGSVQPQTSTGSAQPQTSTESAQPQTSVESTLCETSIKSIIKQRIIAASAQRQTSTESAQPQTSTGSAQPQTNTGSAQPQTSTESAQPQTSTESAQPQTSVESTLCETSIKSIIKQQIIAASANRPELQIIALPMVRQPVTEDGRQIITHRTDFLYTWTIGNYSESSELIAEKFESTVFPDQDPDSSQHFSWSLELYPRGSNPQFDEYISMKILCRNPYKRYIKAECQFEIENCKHEKSHVMQCKFHYVETGVYTIEKWLKRDILEQEKETLLPNGVLKIICQIRTYIRTTSTTNITEDSLFALSEDIKKLYLNPKFSDYTLISRKHKFPVHKSILSARSTIFKLMFKCDTDSVSTKISDVNTGVLKELLRYIYTDRVKNLKKHAMKLMMASDLYGVYGCKVMCEKVICNDLKADEALDLLVICHNHAARYLEEEVRRFIYANARDVVNSPSYKMVRRKNYPILRSVLETLASWKTQEESKNLL
ncbi:speckle-type POZ protein B-like isoform X1 [Nasonia vitripennis]|uniref:Uncharacterized protein n=1 Tax=Nasonia vitripennis TaxID=7425 RepID=A0A7M7LQR4_NASVI|nr:speckle-type POZ protein B-like isoform X1 [Nasonia vitripennis]